MLCAWSATINQTHKSRTPEHFSCEAVENVVREKSAEANMLETYAPASQLRVKVFSFSFKIEIRCAWMKGFMCRRRTYSSNRMNGAIEGSRQRGLGEGRGRREGKRVKKKIILHAAAFTIASICCKAHSTAEHTLYKLYSSVERPKNIAYASITLC